MIDCIKKLAKSNLSSRRNSGWRFRGHQSIMALYEKQLGKVAGPSPEFGFFRIQTLENGDGDSMSRARSS